MPLCGGYTEPLLQPTASPFLESPCICKPPFPTLPSCLEPAQERSHIFLHGRLVLSTRCKGTLQPDCQTLCTANELEACTADYPCGLVYSTNLEPQSWTKLDLPAPPRLLFGHDSQAKFGQSCAAVPQDILMSTDRHTTVFASVNTGTCARFHKSSTITQQLCSRH